MRYFFKELVNHPIKHNGNSIPWELVERNKGVRSFDDANDAALIALLDREADLKRNGVRRISAETYAELKKNTNSARSTPTYDNIVPPIRVVDTEALLPKLRSVEKPAASVSAPPPSAPTPPPTAPPHSTPAETIERKKGRRGKLSDLLAKEKTIGESA